MRLVPALYTRHWLPKAAEWSAPSEQDYSGTDRHNPLKDDDKPKSPCPPFLVVVSHERDGYCGPHEANARNPEANDSE